MSVFTGRIIDGLRRRLAAAGMSRHHRALSATAEAEVYLALLTGARDHTAQPPVEPVDNSTRSSRTDQDRPGEHAAAETSLGTPASTAAQALAALRSQLRDGLFVTGDNVMSPPDTAFTANSLVRLATVLEHHPGRFTDITETVLNLLAQIADALVTGGIHTPNHRWEIASALTGCARLLDREDCRLRAEQWLAEGVDLQPDGFYSERSPNYAVHVSGPSLWALAESLDRPDLFHAVHTNVHTHAATTDPQGRVETMQSRRQDQFDDFPVSQFVPLFLRCATHFGCEQCLAWWAGAQVLGEWNYLISAYDGLLGRGEIPAQQVGAFELKPAVYEDSGLAVIGGDDARLVGHKLVDHTRSLPIASGVNVNPVLFRWGTATGGVRAIRLARRFFNLGPLRPTDWVIDDNSIELLVRKAAKYYQPLAPEHLNPNGAYEMQFEGRFSAAMNFDSRSHVEVVLETSIKATLEPEACLLELRSEGPAIGMALELLLDADVPDEVLVVKQSVSVGELQIEVLSDGYGALPVEEMSGYEPGDPYDFLHGTDGHTGLRAIVPLSSERPSIIRISKTVVTVSV